MNKLIIAIDGLVATGKGTTAKLLAERLGWLYIDTGAMYRAATLVALRDGWIAASDDEKASHLLRYHMEFNKNPVTGYAEMWVDGENVESAIRATELGLSMTPIVTCRPLRKVLETKQRAFGNHHNLVADGRDMGTVVFPDAKWKFFLTCDSAIRTERRYRQLLDAGKHPNKELIATEIQQRDRVDYLGPEAINKKAEDAIEIDTTHFTIDEQVEKILSFIRS